MDVIPYAVGGAAEQVAASERLWREVGAGRMPATARWYGYTRAALVLGVGQALEEVDEEACRAAGVEVVRRASGGTAVLVGVTSLALDVAVPDTAAVGGTDVVEAYRWLGVGLARALRRVAPETQIAVAGVAEARADRAAQRGAVPGSGEALRGLACFGTLSPYEVTHGGRKLVGLSQVRKRGVVMYQAGLYTRFAGRDLAGLLALPPGQREVLAVELDRRVATLEDLGLSAGVLPELMRVVHEELRAAAAEVELGAASPGQ
ncbi:MAG TPA: ligase [Chloroflexota bacterium]|nr:ligase [Chloroflexota bacterium]